MTSLIHPSDSETKQAARTYRDHQRPLWQRILFSRDVAVWAALVVVYLYASATVPFFDRPITITYLLLDVAPILLIALPMTLVIITGEIDLSVASTVALASVSFGVLYDKGTPILLAALAALLVGVVCGAFNGFLVTTVGLPSLAVTIGTLALYRGIAVGLLGTTAVTDFPDTWTDWARGRIGESDIPSIMIPFAVLAILFILLLHFTAFGRGVYAIGLNEGAARFSGIRVERTKLLLFVLTGVVSALAGIYYTLRYGSARGDNANGMELQVIAAVLLGGVSIFGGRGALPGVIAGVLLIGAIGSALRLADQTADVINIVTGLLLVVSVVGSSVLGWVSSRRRRRGGPGAQSSATSPGTSTPGVPQSDTDTPVGEREREDR